MEPKRILIWEQNWLGDALFSTPFIKALRKKYGAAHIAVIVRPACKEILEGNPRINEIILYDDRGSERGAAAKVSFLMALRKAGFDTCFLLHRSLTRALIAYLAGIRRRIGFFYGKRNFVLTDIVPAPKEPCHKIEYFLKLAEYIGADTSDKKLDFFIDEKSRESLSSLLALNGVGEKDRIIALNPGGNWPAKTWPEENFAELSDDLRRAFGVKVVITGSEKDISKALRIQEAAQSQAVIICGKTSLKELGALFERAAVVVSGDSGPLHIALAVGAPVIALYGPTSPALTGPYGEWNWRLIQKDTGCQIPCYDLDCANNRCMKAIAVQDIMDEVGALMK